MLLEHHCPTGDFLYILDLGPLAGIERTTFGYEARSDVATIILIDPI
jgi:hypothetical protein